MIRIERTTYALRIPISKDSNPAKQLETLAKNADFWPKITQKLSESFCKFTNLIVDSCSAYAPPPEGVAGSVRSPLSRFTPSKSKSERRTNATMKTKKPKV